MSKFIDSRSCHSSRGNINGLVGLLAIISPCWYIRLSYHSSLHINRWVMRLSTIQVMAENLLQWALHYCNIAGSAEKKGLFGLYVKRSTAHRHKNVIQGHYTENMGKR